MGGVAAGVDGGVEEGAVGADGCAVQGAYLSLFQ